MMDALAAVISAGGSSGPVPPPTDPYFAYVQLLCPYDVDFTDVIGHSTTGVITGTVSADQSKFGGKSLKIVTVSPNEAVKYSTAAGDFNFGTGDYTVELWLYITSYVAGAGFFTGSENNGAFQLGMKTGSDWGVGSYSVAWRQTTTTLPSLNAWHHIAACRSSGTQKLFIDGVSVSSAASATNFVGGSIAYVGGVPGNDSIAGGFIDEIRVTPGIARYTADFTPPTAPFPTS